MSKTTILYKDIAPGSEEDAEVITGDALEGAVPDQLPFGMETSPYITGELNAWGLNGAYGYFGAVAFWSEKQSEDDCYFADPPVIEMNFDAQYSSIGIYIEFDPATGDHCAALNIKWYQGEELKTDVDFRPDSAKYFCQQNVTSYNKIVVTLLQTNLPRRYAKVSRILLGRLRTFDMTEIRNASITNQMDLLTMELPISTLRWTLESREDVEYIFQRKQPMEVRNGETLLGVFYIEESERITERMYDLACHNAFGILDEGSFPGGIYTDKSAKELLSEIIGSDFALAFEVEDTTLTGVILPGTKRQAAQQVLFAWGACISTDGHDGIRVFSLSTESVSIGDDRTFLGASIKTDAIVTRVVVVAHTYAEDENGSVEIGGVLYKDTQTVFMVDNPDITSSDKQKIKRISNATLVSPDIGQAVAQRVYDYYARRNTQSAKIVWSGEHLGDCVSIPNNWDGTMTGNVTSLEIKLSNTVVASCKTMGV